MVRWHGLPGNYPEKPDPLRAAVLAAETTRTDLLAIVEHVLPVPVLLLVAAALAVLTLAWTAYRAVRGPGRVTS